MHNRIEIEGRTVEVELSKAAHRALGQRAKPLVVEMELYFSCLIRKKVRFPETLSSPEDCQRLADDNLCIRFRPVMTRACGKDYEGDEPPLTEFPIANPRPYVPHWLSIDYRGGQWQGEFGYRPDH